MSQLGAQGHFNLAKPKFETENSLKNIIIKSSNEYIRSIFRLSSYSENESNIKADSSANKSELVEINVKNNSTVPNEPERTESIQHSSNQQKEDTKESTDDLPCEKKIVNVITPGKENELKTKEKKEYRDSDSWTDDEDSSSSSSSDSDSEFEFGSLPPSSPKVICVKTKGELDLEDLPNIEYLSISAEEKDLKKVGKVHGVVSKIVVVKATKDEKPLDIDSVLFLGPNKPLGRIFEVFGPVVEPFYTILFNSPEDISDKGLIVGDDVFFAPFKNEITSYVFVDVLRQQKGSDASWKDNNEPPEEHLDYSDDEQERAAKLKRQAKNRTRDTDDDNEVQIIPNKKSLNEKRHFNNTSYTQKKKESWNIGNSANNMNDSQTIRCFNQSNRNSIPVWISEPSPFLGADPSPTQTSFASTSSTQPFQLKPPAPIFIDNRVQNNRPEKQMKPGKLRLNPKQTFIPRQHRNQSRPLARSQSQAPPNVNTQYFPSSQRPPPEMQNNGTAHYFHPHQRPQLNSSQPMIFQNRNQHVFGQAVDTISSFPPMSPASPMSYGHTMSQAPYMSLPPNMSPTAPMSPAPYISFPPPMSPAVSMSPAPTLPFAHPMSPAPSMHNSNLVVYVPQNGYSPVQSPNQYWQPQNQPMPSFNNVRQNLPPLTIQVPPLSSPPPALSFSSVPVQIYNNFTSPPPFQYGEY